MTSFRDEELRAEMELEEAHDRAIEDLRDEALEREVQSQVERAFAALALETIDPLTRRTMSRQLESVLTYLADEGLAGSETPPISEDEWEEIQEKDSIAIDDRLQHHAMLAQVELVRAIEAARQAPDNAATQARVAETTATAQESLETWMARRKRRENNAALRDAIINRVKQLDWTREEFADKAGISLSTVRNLLVSDDPDRKWRKPVQRAVEDALGWGRGSFEQLLEKGYLSEPPWGWPTSSLPTDKRALRINLDPQHADRLETIALREGRSINAVLGDAIRIYLKVYGPES